MPDTGADRTACGLDILEMLNIDVANLCDSTTDLHAADGRVVHQLGEFNAVFQCGDIKAHDTVNVIDGTSGLYLSWYTSKALAFLPQDYPRQTIATMNVEIAAVSQNDDMASSDDDPGLVGSYIVPEPRIPASQVTQEKLVSHFSRSFDGNVYTMPGETFRIHMEDNPEPFCTRVPRSVPFAYKERLERKLKQWQDQSIIAPVTEPTEWCAPIVVTPKKNSEDIRVCVDLSKLNRFVKRELYASPSPREVVADIALTKAKYFTKFDALSGYHQCPLAEESQALTTFITPLGRYKFLRAPFGLSSISEHYNRRMAEALEGIPCIRRITDDFVAYDETWEEHVLHVTEILMRCAKGGISLDYSKFQFGCTEVEFGG